MANLPQSSQSDSMDSLTVTREQFRLAKKDELEYLAQALGNVSGSYTTETINPTAVTLQGTPTLATAAEPAAADSSLRLVNTRWVKQNAASTGGTAPTSPVRGQIWIDTSQDPPVMNVWDDTPPPGAWVPTGGGASVEIGDTPPAAPTAGDMWWNSDDGRLYIYYKDADSSQWVDASPDSVAPPDLWSRTGTTISPKTTGDSLDMGSFNVDGGAPADSVNLDSSGRLLVGTSNARTNIDYEFGSATTQAQIEGAFAIPGFSIIQNYDSGTQAAPAILVLGRSGATSIDSNTIVADENTVGEIDFSGSDGSSFTRLASIKGSVDGAPGTDNMPGRLTFSTTPSGSATPVERMRVNNKGLTDLFSEGTAGTFSFRNAAGAGGTVNLLSGFHSALSTQSGTQSFVVRTNGNVQNTNNSYTGISDIKLKENIVDAKSQWDDIKGLRVVNYNFKPETGHETFKQLGLIAQEVEQVCPGLVGESPDLDAEGNDLGTTTKNVNYSILYMKAVGALQEALTRIEQLETKVAALEGGAI